MRKGSDLIGWGMSSCALETNRGPAAARIRIHADGRIVVETGFEEMGTGLPAMVQVVAGEILGCAPEVIEVRHGDSTLSAHASGFGSMSTMGIGRDPGGDQRRRHRPRYDCGAHASRSFVADLGWLR
jgi:xanthine dehydrogenase YagR molybdenum-binding subunit